ncbi:MAG: MFS transporter [Bacteroidota bacterium]|jgi:MFS family permease|nr:MFS transporter [Cytophagales bacterium]MCE2958582.1 MFS transporter [Flammeovirgaceae bacterium]MCZ8070643.1 MFS transporter [Cytophagales bacterium]
MHPSRVAVKLVFFINGFVHASIAARFVRMQEIYSIDKGTLGFVLLSQSIGAFLAMPFTGWLIMRNGSRRITIFSVFLYCVFVPLVPVLPNVVALISLFFVMGLTAGMLDVSMNSQAVMVEQNLGKPIMTSFHAIFSIGMVAGALFGTLFINLGVTLFIHLLVVTLLALAGAAWARYNLIHDKPKEKVRGEPAFRLPNAAMVSIGVIAFCSMLGEGAMADWSSVYMKSIATDEGLTTMGLFGFAFAMTLGRFFGDGARLKFGDRKLMVWCGVIALFGMAVMLSLENAYLAIAGFFLVGIGLSAIVPIAYSIAGNTKDLPPGVGLAMVTTVGYSGFLFGPPIIGLLADWQTLRVALGFVAVLFLVMTVLSARYQAK